MQENDKDLDPYYERKNREVCEMEGCMCVMFAVLWLLSPAICLAADIYRAVS